MLHAVALKTLAQGPSLLARGEGIAFVGFMLGGLFLVSTRKGKETREYDGFLRGRYLAQYYLRWPLIALGFAGLAMALVAIL
jgi:hypothetical protein